MTTLKEATKPNFTLTLEVKGVNYQVQPVNGGFDLTKPNGETYRVTKGDGGVACECKDYFYRRAGLDSLGCKHVQALVACGLISR